RLPTACVCRPTMGRSAAVRRGIDEVITVLLLAIPIAAIVTFWSNGGWGQDSTPTWWWILAVLSAALGVARWSIRRRERAQAVGRSRRVVNDAPAVLQAWWFLGATLVYLFWFGVAVALVVAGNLLGRIVGVV